MKSMNAVRASAARMESTTKVRLVQRIWSGIGGRGAPGVALAAALALAGPTAGWRAAAAQDAQPQDVPSQTAPQPDPGPTGDSTPAASDDLQAGQAVAADPPSRVARISVLMGNVSVEPASVNQFSAAEVNDPMTSGDRVYTDVGAIAELQTGSLAVRLGQQTDLTVQAMTDTLAQFGLAQGELHLRSFGIDSGSTLELDTPNVAVTVLQPGDVRVDVDPNSDSTTVWLISGQVEVDGNNLQQVMTAGQRVRLVGSDPVAAQWLSQAAADGLDDFSNSRDEVYQNALASESAYVNPDTIGAADLAGNGDWQMDPDFGAVWYPSGVAVGWLPYSCGRWAWVAPWGWTWVGCQTWGFAPFHYGRWNRFGDRWGWIPGPPVLHPIYSPALVVFVGGSGFRAGGAPLTGWFPLGPGEPYRPWYHASAVYLNRINAVNIYAPQPRRTDANADENPPVYVNRGFGTVAMPQASFAAGRAVAQAAVHPAPEQLAQAQVLAHPLITPERSTVVPLPARAAPAHLQRPMLASRPAEAGTSSSAQPAPSVSRPAASGQRAPERAAGSAGESTSGAPAPRPLYHRAVPPPPRPSFDQQQQAIESTDPGRPLSPQQMTNLQKGQPAGPEPQHEAAHPAAAPKPVARPAPPSRPK